MFKYVFFDVDSLVPSQNGRTFVCHPNTEANSEQLFETYTAIGHMAVPFFFTMDVKLFPSQLSSKRGDQLLVPYDKTDRSWESAIEGKYKFFLSKENTSENAIFKNNQNAEDCLEFIKKQVSTSEWIVFGNGLKDNVDHVICKLLEGKRKVRYIPELTVAAEGESQEQIDFYLGSWQDKGVLPVALSKVMELVSRKK